MGQSGVGTLAVVTSGGTAAPILSIRVYNDAGTLGTSGFTEEERKPSDALAAGSRAVLIAPFDLAAFRFNIGVRTLDAGAWMTVTLRDQAGNVRRTDEKTYPGNSFQQIDAASFLGVALLDNDTITIDVNTGSLFVYGVTADNRTNDPTFEEARKVF